MTVTASTTIAGVSVFAQGKPSGDPFDIALSAEGIEIRLTGQQPRHLSWERVTEWELEERADRVVLTLRGDGATTPLLVSGWSVDDLERLLRTVTSGTGTGNGPETESKAEGNGSAVAVAVSEPAAPADDPVLEAPAAPVASRRERRRSRRVRIGGKAVLTVVLLLVLATAVTLVLLQSAGVIDWGFLGPTV